jgi:hypothetical protein
MKKENQSEKRSFGKKKKKKGEKVGPIDAQGGCITKKG